MSFFGNFEKALGIEQKNSKKNKKDKKEIIREKLGKKLTKKELQKNDKEEAAEILETKKEIITTPESAKKTDKAWFEQEGQLTVDVFQTNDEIFVQSAIAGVGTQDIDITVENDMIIIKGRREKPTDLVPETGKKDYFYQECYWGPFSRQIILPAEVDSSKIEATMKSGVLTIKIPKIQKESKKKISVKSEDEEE